MVALVLNGTQFMLLEPVKESVNLMLAGIAAFLLGGWASYFCIYFYSACVSFFV